jgi:hypothetical protein
MLDVVNPPPGSQALRVPRFSARSGGDCYTGENMSRGRCAHVFGRLVLGIVILCCAIAVCAPARARPALPAARPLRVLLVGNSYTKFNMMPRLLSRLSLAVHGVRPLHVDFETHGGYSLRMHWRAGLAVERIRHGHYDFVVLQGHSLSAVDHADELDEYAERFEHLIAETGAHTVLYQTWPRKDGSREYAKNEHVHSFDEMATRVDGVYTEIAARLGARLAPVGRAFVRAVANVPGLALYRSDDSHPTPAGSFLAACVLYGALTGEDPRASGYVPFGSSATEAEQIKALAASVLDAQPPTREAPSAPPAPTPATPDVQVASLPESAAPLAPGAALEAGTAVESPAEPEPLESAPLPVEAAMPEPEPVPAVAAASAPPAPQ